MKIGWVLGWAVPAAWFAPLARAAFPEAGHAFFEAEPEALARLERAGPFDWVAGYSLGSLLLLLEPARAARLGRVALLAPIFAFPLEAGCGGRIPRAQVRHLARWLRLEPAAALADFYARAGLAPAPSAPPSAAALEWGLERLENARAEPPLPAGWRGWCGTDDPLLDAARLQAVAPTVAPVAGASHHPAGLLRAFAAAIPRPAAIP